MVGFWSAGVGLCFLPKPAIFVPGEDMLQAEAGPRRGPRGGDLILHRVQSKQVKFQQISAGDMNLGRSKIEILWDFMYVYVFFFKL